MSIQQREAVVAEVRSWMGTPWRHAANIKGAAVDCAMLLVEVFTRTGVVPSFDPRPYPKAWFMHRDEERLLEWLERVGAKEVAIDTAQIGDVLAYKYGRCYGHVGVLVAPQRIIHAYARVGQVIETETFDIELATRFPKAFSMWSIQ